MSDITKTVIGTKGCYGCGVCVKACNKQVLDIQLNSDGFFEPVAINVGNCTGCGLCKNVCSFRKI